MAHVRQELALVLVGSLQLGGLFCQDHLRVAQLVALRLQRLCLLFELGVGLLELRLLRFQPQLGFLQRAGLYFELFIADAQLFLLGLQLFGLALRLGEQLLEPRAILR